MESLTRVQPTRSGHVSCIDMLDVASSNVMLTVELQSVPRTAAVASISVGICGARKTGKAHLQHPRWSL